MIWQNTPLNFHERITHMDLIRTLNSIGKSTFVKYYDNFKTKDREECIAQFAEAYTDNAKNTRTRHAQRIFRENKQIEALEIIVNSNRVDDVTRKRAKEILLIETK